MEELKDANNTITYEMKPSLKAKRIRITVFKDQVKVTFPQGMNLTKVREFVELKKEWILKTMEKYKTLSAQLPARRYTEGEEYYFCGHKYVLKVKTYDGPNPLLRIMERDFWVCLPESMPKENEPAVIKEVLAAWYKEQARLIYKERLDFYSKIMGLEYHQLKIKNQRTRWGSCSAKGNINLNWRVIMAPYEVIDYLIIHELAHLKYMNHSREFWKLVESHLPDYLRWKKWLKENGKYLVL